MENYLYSKIKPIIDGWDANNVYAISFLLCSNEENRYKGYENLPELTIGYNTEYGCEFSPVDSEERWNVAFWEQDFEPVISSEAEGSWDALLAWYESQDIQNIGYEDEETAYNEEMEYIGKGPNGYYELLCAVSNVAKRLQEEGVIRSKFGRIPMLVHDLEYAWYSIEATENANKENQADDFLNCIKSW